VQQSLTAFPSPEELYQRYSAANRSVTGGVAAETRQPYLDPLVVPCYTVDGRQPRYYQEIAINKAVQAISRGQRRVLLTMATGTGKTYMALQIAWKLSRAGRARRILFLADHLVLRDQAYNAFAAFEDARTVIDEGKAPTTRDVYFAIYQALYSKTGTGDGQATQQGQRSTCWCKE
jgi:type I restriction enzyme R subunit